MSFEVQTLLERIARSSDFEAEAARVSQSLSKPELLSLQSIARRIDERRNARQILDADQDEKGRSEALTADRAKHFLLLLTLATNHSDTLAYLPHPLREARLMDWASKTGFDVAFVKEAAILGPNGLNLMLKAA